MKQFETVLTLLRIIIDAQCDLYCVISPGYQTMSEMNQPLFKFIKGASSVNDTNKLPKINEWLPSWNADAYNLLIDENSDKTYTLIMILSCKDILLILMKKKLNIINYSYL